jgi:hypothetical protein
LLRRGIGMGLDGEAAGVLLELEAAEASPACGTFDSSSSGI